MALIISALAGLWYVRQQQIEELALYPLPGARTEQRSGTLERIDGNRLRLKNNRRISLVYLSDRTTFRVLGDDGVYTEGSRSDLTEGVFVAVHIDAIDDRVPVFGITIYPAE